MRLTKEFIIQELEKKGIRFKVSSTSISILCPFHEEQKPSCHISLGVKVPIGIFHCLGCHASGKWNKLASVLGLQKVGKEGSLEEQPIVVNSPINGIILSEDEEYNIFNDVDVIELPTNFKWRKFDYKFLKKLDAKLIWTELNYIYLIFPVLYENVIRGYIRCKITGKEPGPKYWIKGSIKYLFPFDYVVSNMNLSNGIVLVEGVTDALRLIKFGIPTLSVLGTALTKTMLEQLQSLFISKVILCFDGDRGGYEGVLGNQNRKGCASVLEELGYDVRVLFPPKDKDPYEMPFRYIKVLKYLLSI